MWDHWIDGTQQDMIDNQIQFQAHHEGRTQNQNTARVEQVAGEHCQALMRSGDCEEPRRRSDVENCLYKLNLGGCDSLPRVHPCGALELIENCVDPFADQRENGCTSLRRAANCDVKPAPEKLAGLSRINYDPD